MITQSAYSSLAHSSHSTPSPVTFQTDLVFVAFQRATIIVFVAFQRATIVVFVAFQRATILYL